LTPRLVRGARDDLAGGQRWYNDKEHGLGGRFRRAVAATVDRILAAPRAAPLWPGVDPDLRVQRRHVHRWPYSVAYMVRGERLVIVAIAHHRRRPDYWLDRIQ
jgi:plasmid stabilization system protein ParE